MNDCLCLVVVSHIPSVAIVLFIPLRIHMVESKGVTLAFPYANAARAGCIRVGAMLNRPSTCAMHRRQDGVGHHVWNAMKSHQESSREDRSLDNQNKTKNLPPVQFDIYSSTPLLHK